MKIKWNPLSKKRNIPKKNMNWTQAKRKFPRLNPYGDADRDGRINIRDCRPFNRMRQDEDWEKKGWPSKESFERQMERLKSEPVEMVGDVDILEDD